MKLWGGRFERASDGLADDFHSSLPFDCRLWKQDIRGSIAHARMLGAQGILEKGEADLIIRGLEGIRDDIKRGALSFEGAADEDIHSFTERVLTERIGPTGGRLHTGRSRNDQVALDMRLYALESIDETAAALKQLCQTLITLAKAHLDTVMPGYTHLQKAQPVTLAHHAMAWVQMLLRDLQRLGDIRPRAAVMPLGAGALAATTYPLDREMVASELSMGPISQNSLDAVSDRDFLIEYAAAAGISMMHLSRFCEELVLWSTGEFGFIEIDDAYSTGSSIMPQKKNPDMAELIRGKTGRVYGDLMALLSVMKSLPLAYNKDMQEDKEAFFDARDTWLACLRVFDGMAATLRVRKDAMAQGADGGFTNATDAADYLTKKGIPFRETHRIVGQLVLYCLERGKALAALSLEEFKALSPSFDQDVYEAISIQTCVAQRSIPGGPAPAAVLESIAAAQASLAAL